MIWKNSYIKGTQDTMSKRRKSRRQFRTKGTRKAIGHNAPSRLERQNLSLPSLMDTAPPLIVAEMQAMKEQMEVMMNALKG